MSTIEWTEATWNPVVGCSRVSAGCDNCYAILEAHRKGGLFPHYAGLTEHKDGRIDWTGKFATAPDHIFEKPLRTAKPTVWFVNSMSDLFGEGVADATIARVFAIMNSTPQHIYQVLTKRPNRALRLAPSLNWPPNIWMGTSIETDKLTIRADYLRKIPAAVRFISAEPLLGALPSLDLTGIHWLIAGGESGRSRDKVRPMAIDWARDLRHRCVGAGTAFFFKQWGNWDSAGEWCRSKRDAGRTLDGRTWDEMPVVSQEPTTWGSIDHFRIALATEHADEEAPPLHNDDTPRITLRKPIWTALRDLGPMEGSALRTHVLDAEGLHAASARLVNYHAWALVDLQAKGWVESFEGTVPGKRGRTRKAKLYRAIKPRVRVRAEREAA